MEVEFDYSKLRGRIKELFGTEKKFAEELDMNRSLFSQKLNNKTDFKQPEILKIVSLLKIENPEIMSYFFTPKVRKTE